MSAARIIKRTTLWAARVGAVASASVGVVGCANLTPPTKQDVYDKAMEGVAVPSSWSASAETNAFRPDWLGFAEDAQLQSLIDEAMAHNPDMRSASTRLEQARLQMKIAGSDLLPSIGFGAKYSNSLQPADGLDINGFGVVLNWEVDLWGRARAEKKAGVASYRSAEADYVYARQSLAAMTARAWLVSIEATRQSALAQQMQKDAASSAGLVVDRERVGKASHQDVSMAQAQTQQMEDAVYQAEQGREQALRALELIVGRYPSATVAVPTALPPLVRVKTGPQCHFLTVNPCH